MWERARVRRAAAVQPCSSPRSKGTCSSPFSPERHKRSVPSSGRQREEKGSVVFLSLFLSPSLLITTLLTRSESPDGNPPVLPPPGSLSMTNLSSSVWEREREKEGRRERGRGRERERGREYLTQNPQGEQTTHALYIWQFEGTQREQGWIEWPDQCHSLYSQWWFESKTHQL